MNATYRHRPKRRQVPTQEGGSQMIKVPNSPTGQILEAGPDWLVLVDVMTGLE